MTIQPGADTTQAEMFFLCVGNGKRGPYASEKRCAEVYREMNDSGQITADPLVPISIRNDEGELSWVIR